ncbi:hypothetical protein GVN18_36390 [Pseudomonas sp. ODNR1LW]|nr:hypothetical protein [Pseudomonas sp. ODNR1LW]
MSAIRPGLPQTLPPAGGETSSVRNAQAAFFRAALNQVQTSPVQAAPVAPQPTIAAARPAAAQPATEGQPPRIMRPGTYLDIKV